MDAEDLVARYRTGERDFGNTDLSRADLGSASLRGANLDGADLGGAILRDADLREANLERSHLFDADLSGADLSGADLREVNLRGANLLQTKLDDATRLNFHWRWIWSVRNEELGPVLIDGFRRAGLPFDLAAMRRIASWAYARLEASGGLCWQGDLPKSERMVNLAPEWRRILEDVQL